MAVGGGEREDGGGWGRGGHACAWRVQGVEWERRPREVTETRKATKNDASVYSLYQQ